MFSKRMACHALIVSVLAASLFLGCAGGRRTAEEPPGAQPSPIAATLRGIGASPAAMSVAEPMRPFFAAGLGLILLGSLAACVGGKGTGALLICLGAATTATGVLFIQYPWVALLLAVAAGAIAAAAAWDRLRARRELARNSEALEKTTEVIQNAPEGKAIKEGLAGLGPEAEDMIRSVIGPIKEKLRREGKIA